MTASEVPKMIYGPEDQWSSNVQQRPRCARRLASSRCVLASVTKALNGYCAEFETMRDAVIEAVGAVRAAVE